MISIFLVGCVWQFNGCIETGQAEETCYRRWDECQMIAMGMPLEDGDIEATVSYPDDANDGEVEEGGQEQEATATRAVSAVPVRSK